MEDGRNKVFNKLTVCKNNSEGKLHVHSPESNFFFTQPGDFMLDLILYSSNSFTPPN